MKELLFEILVDIVIFALSSVFLNDRVYLQDRNDTKHIYRYGYEWDRK
jgi:hypothetical protein